jgi:hypothetical protein
MAEDPKLIAEFQRQLAIIDEQINQINASDRFAESDGRTMKQLLAEFRNLFRLLLFGIPSIPPDGGA